MIFIESIPDETLIIVTADHETGGVVLGNGNYSLNLPSTPISNDEWNSVYKRNRKSA